MAPIEYAYPYLLSPMILQVRLLEFRFSGRAVANSLHCCSCYREGFRDPKPRGSGDLGSRLQVAI